MRANFDRAILLLFESEGGYVDDAADKAGPTNYGITLPTLAAHRGRPVAKAEILVLTRDEAEVIYRDLFWAKVQGDDLPSGIDYAVFDAAVHSGPRQAARWLQNALGVASDGTIGPETLAASKSAQAVTLIDAFCDKRLAALRGLSTFSRFGRGWESRVNRVRGDALTFSNPLFSTPPQTRKELPMDQTQSIFQSRTIWANAIGFIAFILSLTGNGVSLDTGQLTDSVMQLITAGSFLASTVFRILSTNKVAL
jgi:lysozyme family protein